MTIDGAAPPADVHRRLGAWHTRIRVAMATRILDLPFATYAITDDLPDIHDLNLAMVTAPVPPDVLLRSVDRVAEAAGWRHRRIEIDDAAVADRLRDPLRRAGYTEQQFVTMRLDSGPAGMAATSAASATIVDIVDQLDLARAVAAEQPWADSARLVDELVERELRLARVADCRAVVAPRRDAVSRCLLLSDADLVEIDAVGTLRAHRGQGWSRAVVACAIAEARAATAAHVVLVADVDDWPRSWYARLGFREIGRSVAFDRPAPSE